MLQQSTLEFFRELRENNHKGWFDLNRSRYEQVKKDYQSMTASLLDGMKKVDPDLAALQVKDCTFRINRDIRFSKEKNPYKTHLAVIMTPFGRRMQYAGYYFHWDEVQGSFAGGGVYMPEAEILKKIRREVSDFYEDLDQVLIDPDFQRIYGDFDRDPQVVLSRPPKGFRPDDPAIEYLKLKSYTATSELPNEIISDKSGAKKIVEMLAALKPMIDFLNRAIKGID